MAFRWLQRSLREIRGLFADRPQQPSQMAHSRRGIHERPSAGQLLPPPRPLLSYDNSELVLRHVSLEYHREWIQDTADKLARDEDDSLVQMVTLCLHDILPPELDLWLQFVATLHRIPALLFEFKSEGFTLTSFQVQCIVHFLQDPNLTFVRLGFTDTSSRRNLSRTHARHYNKRVSIPLLRALATNTSAIKLSWSMPHPTNIIQEWVGLLRTNQLLQSIQIVGGWRQFKPCYGWMTTESPEIIALAAALSDNKSMFHFDLGEIPEVCPRGNQNFMRMLQCKLNFACYCNWVRHVHPATVLWPRFIGSKLHTSQVGFPKYHVSLVYLFLRHKIDGLVGQEGSKDDVDVSTDKRFV